MDAGARIGEVLETLVRDKVVMGAVAGAVIDGETTIVAAGAAPRTGLYDIGSIAKTFTGLLLAVMDQRGELSIHDPIDRWLPEGTRAPAQGERRITLLDLVTQRSGLPRLAPGRRGRAMLHLSDPYRDETPKSLFAALSKVELERPIGSAFEYSNFGFTLLGTILGRAAGGSYADALRERVLDPMGLADTFVWPVADARKVQGHAVAKPVREWSMPSPGAGGIWSTIDDLLRYLAILKDPAGTPIEQAVAAALEPLADAADGRRIAMGWLTPMGSLDARWHNGGTGGFSSMAIIECSAPVVVAGLANSGPPHGKPGIDAAIAGLSKEFAARA